MTIFVYLYVHMYIYIYIYILSCREVLMYNGPFVNVMDGRVCNVAHF